MKKTNLVSFLIYVICLALVVGFLFGTFESGAMDVPYSQALQQLKNENVESFEVVGNTITMKLYEPYNGEKTISAAMMDPEGFSREMAPLLEEQTASGKLKSYDFLASEGYSPFDLVVPLLLVGLVLLIVWVFLTARANRSNPMAGFTRARTVLGVPDHKKVTFDDVAGADEEKEQLREIVDFLQNPEKYTSIGARIPHGILLVGPPGTGKTLIARAVAGEADVQFLSISGSDFVEMYVGVGASRVRDLFEQAKRIAPAIIFIDEIDAVGRKRGSGLGGGHDEKEQTLNQLLVEMDGFSKNEGVIVLAATNRPDILDPALLRPGRFDRQIHVGRPDVKGREEILKIHARDKRLDETVSLKTLARSTAGFTGADLSNLLNEAAIRAARDNRPAMTMEDLNESLMKIMAGPAKKSRVPNRKDLKITAYHEAGHAVAMYCLPTHDPVRHVSIVPRGQSLGATWYMPKDDSSNPTRNEMYEQIVSLLGGRVAEEIFLRDISVGASQDIERATKLAKDMVARYGMSDALGAVCYLDGGEVFIGRDYQNTKSYSEKYAAVIDDQVKCLIDKAYEHCRELLTANSQRVQAVVDYLLTNESMTGEQFAACMEGREIGNASQTSMFDAFGETE